MEIAAHTPGSFCTSVLRTRDLDRAAAFYRALGAWTFQDVTSGHRLMLFGGKTVASLHQISEGPDLWVPHVSIENIERTTADALALGATLVDTAEVPGLANLSTLRDPEGAVFGLWQPAPHPGAQLMEDLGSLWWIEVLSNNVKGAAEFYGSLFGWASTDTSFAPFPTYTIFKRGEISEGGILPIHPDWESTPCWNSIFSVEDCDAMIARAKSLGGSEIFVHTVPKAGRIGSLRDLGGAAFVIRGPVKGTL